MSKKNENKHTFIAFDKDRYYSSREQEQDTHYIDSLRYMIDSQYIFQKGRQQGRTYTSQLIQEYNEKLRGDVMGVIMLKCNCCGHDNRLNNKGKVGDIAVCSNCKGTSFGVCVSENPISLAYGGSTHKFGSTSMKFDGCDDRVFVKLTEQSSAIIGKIKPTDDSVHTFRISALELLDIDEVAKDLSRDNPVLLVKIKGDISNTQILIHDSIMVKADALGIESPFQLHRLSKDYVLFKIKNLPEPDLDVDDTLTDSEVIDELIDFVKTVKRASIKELTTRINDKPIQVQVIKVNL